MSLVTEVIMNLLYKTFSSVVICLGLSVGAGAASGEITVSGEGAAYAEPDMAMVTLGVTADESTAKEAMDQTSQITAAILERLTGLGIASQDIQTTDLSLNSNWADRVEPNGTPRINGYRSSNRITVRIRNLDQLATMLDAVLSDGANRLDGLTYTLANLEPLMNEARRAAVVDARGKAELFADAAGVELGALVSLSDIGASPQSSEMMSMARVSDVGVPVVEGEISVRARVILVYEIDTP